MWFKVKFYKETSAFADDLDVFVNTEFSSESVTQTSAFLKNFPDFCHLKIFKGV
jgi:hypothetical protein